MIDAHRWRLLGLLFLAVVVSAEVGKVSEIARRFWAWFRGYFWLPCVVCGRMVAGFEDWDRDEPGVHCREHGHRTVRG